MPLSVRSFLKQCLPSPVAMTRLRDRTTLLLTFDDGPDPDHTPRVLDTLEQFGARALFFVPGLRIPRAPHLLREIVARGHALGNHGYSHRQLPSLPWRELLADIEDGRRAIFDACGVHVRFLRPPYGAVSARVVAAAWKTHHRIMLWSADTMEYTHHQGADAATITADLLPQVQPGTIVLSHDDHVLIPDVLQMAIPQMRVDARDLAGALDRLPWYHGARPSIGPSVSPAIEPGDRRRATA